MNLDEKDIDALESYWLEALPEQERTELERRLADDTAFRNAAGEMKATWSALRSVGWQHRLEQLRELEKKMPPVGVETKRVALWVKIAAVAAIGLVLGWLWWRGQAPVQKDTTGAIAMAFFEPYPHSNTTMSSGNSDAQRQKAYLAYDAGEYRMAAPLLEDLFARQQDTLSLLYAGIAWLGAGDAGKSVEKLDEFSKLTNHVADREVAIWYIILGKLKKNEWVEGYFLDSTFTYDSPFQEKLKLLEEQLGQKLN